MEKRLQTSALLDRVLSLTLLQRPIERRLGDLSERTTSESERLFAEELVGIVLHFVELEGCIYRGS